MVGLDIPGPQTEETWPKNTVWKGWIYSRDICLNPLGACLKLLLLVLYRSPEGGMKEWIKTLVFGWLNFWQVPLYIGGNVPEVTASASLYRRLLSLKIKTNFPLILIWKIQPFNILMSATIGCLGKTSWTILQTAVQGLGQLNTLYCLSEKSSHSENRKLCFLTLSKTLSVFVPHTTQRCSWSGGQ